MYSRKPGFFKLSAVGLALALTLSACGHKKPPKPPPSKVPQRVVPTLHQRGSEAILAFPYPTITISGTPLLGIAKIEVWRVAREIPEFAIEVLEQEDALRREAQELLDELGLTLWEVPVPVAGEEGTTGEDGLTADAMAPGDTVPADALEPSDSSVVGESAMAELAASRIAVDETPNPTDDDDADAEEGEQTGEPELTPEEELELRIDGARNLLRSKPTDKASYITATAKEFKAESELMLALEGEEIAAAVIGENVLIRLPLPASLPDGPDIGYLYAVKIFPLDGKPSDLSKLEGVLPVDTPPAPREITIETHANGVMLKWDADQDPQSGFRVYRREAQTRIYGEPVGTVINSLRYFLDSQAIFGARYIYGVSAVDTLEPLLESDFSSEHEVAYQDLFGPAAPRGLVAFPEVGSVRLLWTTVTAADVAGYEVLRRASIEDEAERITDELITRGQHIDEQVASGESWLYSVVAVDSSGNRSEASVETQARVP